jgi:hypothetical protein
MWYVYLEASYTLAGNAFSGFTVAPVYSAIMMHFPWALVAHLWSKRCQDAAHAAELEGDADVDGDAGSAMDSDESDEEETEDGTLEWMAADAT